MTEAHYDVEKFSEWKAKKAPTASDSRVENDFASQLEQEIDQALRATEKTDEAFKTSHRSLKKIEARLEAGRSLTDEDIQQLQQLRQELFTQHGDILDATVDAEEDFFDSAEDHDEAGRKSTREQIFAAQQQRFAYENLLGRIDTLLSSSAGQSAAETPPSTPANSTQETPDKQPSKPQETITEKEEQEFLDEIQEQLDDDDEDDVFEEILTLVDTSPEHLETLRTAPDFSISSINQYFYDLQSELEDVFEDSEVLDEDIDNVFFILESRRSKLESALSQTSVTDSRHSDTEVFFEDTAAQRRQFSEFINDPTKLTNYDRFAEDLSAALLLLRFHDGQLRFSPGEIQTKVKHDISIEDSRSTLFKISRAADFTKEQQTVRDRVQTFLENLTSGVDQQTALRRTLAALKIMKEPRFSSIDQQPEMITKLETLQDEVIDQFLTSINGVSTLDAFLSQSEEDFKNAGFNDKNARSQELKNQILSLLVSSSFDPEEKTQLADVIFEKYKQKLNILEMRFEGIDMDRLDQDFADLEVALDQEPEAKYGASDIVWIREKLKAASKQLEARIKAVDSLNENNGNDVINQWCVKAKQLLEKADKKIEKYELALSRESVFARKIAGESSVYEILFNQVYFDGISASDHSSGLIPKIEFLKNRILAQEYQAQRDQINNDTSKTPVEKSAAIAEVDLAEQTYYTFLDHMAIQINFGTYKNGNVNLESFQEHADNGHSKLIGAFDTSTYRGEVGLWSNTAALMANQALNQDVLGIREGFDAIEQRNTNGETGGPAYKLQTILTDINDILGKPHLYKRGFSSPLCPGRQEPRINSSTFNVDSMIGAGKGGQLVDLLFDYYRDVLFQYDSADTIAFYKQGAKFLAARNDLTSLNFIKLVATQNKSLHPSCAESIVPFGLGCAQTRALYKNNNGGYLASTESIDMSYAVTHDDTYLAIPQFDSNGNPNKKYHFYDRIEEFKELFHHREQVDKPQEEAIHHRKESMGLIFRPVRWDRGFMSRTEFACSVDTKKTGGQEGTVTPKTYFEAASAYMKVFEASVVDIDVDSMSLSQIEGRVGEISTQCSILTALIGSAGNGRFQHIIDSVTALYATFLAKILSSISGNLRRNAIGYLDAYGRNYQKKYNDIKETIIAVLSDTERTKQPYSSKLLTFIGSLGDTAADNVFMNEPERTGFLSNNPQNVRNYNYHLWLEQSAFARRANYEHGTWRTLVEHENRLKYPKSVLDVNPHKILSQVIFDKEEK